jgi:glycosyltransferase involved in cell wall biosynthesis
LSHPILINLSFLLTQPTGISTYAINLIPHLQALEPTLLTAKSLPNFNCYSIPDNLTPAQGSKGHWRRLLWTQTQLPKIYRQLNASLLFSPVTEAPLYNRCRYVVMCHDLIPVRFPQSRSALTYYFRYIVPLVLQQAEHIICNSEATAKDITKFYKINPQKITSILLAYDDQHFRPYKRESDKNCPYFLYIGRHDFYKNLPRLIAAFAAIPNNQDYQLWLAGSPDERYTPKLKEQAAELGIQDRVVFLDYVSYEELPIIISGAIALVFPTLWEGFGLPVLEAMGCGTPVITSNLASLPEIMGDAAILVNPYQMEEITEAMQAIANNSQLRAKLSIDSLQRANQFSWAKTGEKTKEVLARYV